jgi:hypothetical protein
MRRIASSAIAAAALLALSAPAAISAPHFHGGADSSVANNGALVVSFDERGLGNEDITYLLEADAMATWGCFNRGGKNPSAANKRSASQPVSATETFDPRNGRVVGEISTDPPQPPSDFSCPGGQTMRLMSISYTNVTLTDTTNGVSTTAPDASRTFIAG